MGGLVDIDEVCLNVFVGFMEVVFMNKVGVCFI